jgi:transposase
MYFLEGKSYGEIANVMKLPLDTVKSWCRRYRIKNEIPTRDKSGLRKEPVNRDKLHERKPKDKTTAEARISRLEMEVELLRNFLILGEEK